MGAGDQGGGSGAEDSAIRRQFSADPNATAKDARDYFRDRDSGKLAARSYLDSRPTDRTYSDTGAPMDDTFAESIDSRLGSIGVTRNDTSFVNADGKSVGSINSAGNFSGNRDVIAALKGLPSLSDMRQASSRETKYGPGSRAAQEGDINTSLLDFVDFAEDGTVQGMGPNRFMDERGRGQLVYDPSAVIPGLPAFTDSGEFNPQYDPSRESMAGQALQGVTEYIGDGGMMGAVTRGLGGLSKSVGGGNTVESIETPDPINLNPGNFNPTRPELRPTDGSTTENNGIFDAINSGRNSVNKLTSDQLRNLPQYAGGYTGTGADNAFLSADQRGVPNQFDAQGQPGMTNYAERNSPVFNALGLPESAMNMNNDAYAYLFKNDLPSDLEEEMFSQVMPPVGDTSPSLQDLAETEPVITAGFSGFNTNMGKPKPFSNTTNQFDPQQRIIDDALAPLGDRVSMYEDDPSIAFGFGGEPFDLSEGAESIVSPDQTYYDAFANPYSDAEQANTSDLIDNRAAEQALQDVTNMGSLREEYIPPLAGFGGIRSDENAMSSYTGNESLPEFSPAPVINEIANNKEFVSPESPIGPSPFPPRASEPTANFPSGVLPSQNGFNPAGIGDPVENSIEAVITDARNKRIAKLGTATGSENNMPLEQEGPLVERDSRIRDAIAPDGLNDNMYNDGSEIFDLSETYDPSGGGFTDGGGGSFTGCPEGYEPMTLENGETVCVPIEEEVTEEEEVQETPVTPTVRPAMGPSAYTAQAVSPIRPYTLQPGEQGVGSLADILQLQNYPNIV